MKKNCGCLQWISRILPLSFLCSFESIQVCQAAAVVTLFTLEMWLMTLRIHFIGIIFLQQLKLCSNVLYNYV